MEQLRLYRKFVATAIRSRMQYRSDFLTGMLSVVILTGVNIALIAIMLSRFRSLGGWGFWDIVMLYGTLVVDFADGIGDVEVERAEVVERSGQQVRLRFDRREVSASELIVALAGRYAVKDMSVEEPEIEAIVRDIYEHGVQADRSPPDAPPPR